MKVVTVSQMREIERETDQAGTSYGQMMENAGRGVAQAIMDRLDTDGRSVIVLVGPGNNGGDGLVAGRYLAQAGARVAFYLFKPRTIDDPNFARVQQMGLPVVLVKEDEDYQTLHKMIAKADVVVDALLGTGVDRPISGTLKAILQQTGTALDANRRRRAALHQGPVSPRLPTVRSTDLPLVVAVDCPSGLNCDTGCLDTATISADMTVTFAAPKIGQFLFPGAAALGELVVADIGSPVDLPTLEAVGLELATADDIRGLLPPRPLDGHKGTFGKVMIVAGSINYTGAAALAGEAAYRAGAGLVTLAIPGNLHGPLAARLAEATFILLPHEMGAVTEDAVPILIESLEGYDALLIGPGLGRDQKTRAFLKALVAGEKSSAKGRIGFVSSVTACPASHTLTLPPMVIDADGLNLLAELENWPGLLRPNCILTPHPGEMSRLVGRPRDSIVADRIGVAQQAAADWGQVVVLKGAFTVVAAPDGQTTLLPFADPALATAGSGDVLAGAIAALLGMGLAPFWAAVVGAFLHGASGQMAAMEVGGRGVMSGDLPLFLAAALEKIAGGRRPRD
jgi:hydroxyethylthiazole kinase-like uncharacterized protein yjeF